jgi:hypothetical protein
MRKLKRKAAKKRKTTKKVRKTARKERDISENYYHKLQCKDFYQY